MTKKDFTRLLENTLEKIESLNYAEQFIELFSDYFSKRLPVSKLTLFFLNNERTGFKPYFGKKDLHIKLQPITWDANLVIYLKNSKKAIVIKDETLARIRSLKKTSPDLFEKMKVDIVIPLFSFNKFFGFIVIEAGSRTFKILDKIVVFFKIFANILAPQVISERIQIENDRNYYQIYRMDRLAMVGELAASAAHEIKNPLAGISTFLKYFMELEDFSKKDIIDELKVMKDSVHRIDEIVKSLLSFSRYRKKEIHKVNIADIIESSLHSISLKIPEKIEVVKRIEEELSIETEPQQLEQVLINILFNAIEAIGRRDGAIEIYTYATGRERFPSEEYFNISIKDNGPGIEESFKEKLFQPFQTTKEEGTGLGLYTCYGLMKSLGGNIKINSGEWGTEVILSLPYSFDDEG